MFKPGDRVKCVDASKTSLQEDRIYVVKACEKHGVLLEGISYCWYLIKRFELYQEEVATSNDIKDLQHQIDILKKHVELMQCELNQLNPPKYWSSNIPGVIGMKYVQDEASLWGGA